MPWYTQKVAAMVFATPPKSTYEEVRCDTICYTDVLLICAIQKYVCLSLVCHRSMRLLQVRPAIVDSLTPVYKEHVKSQFSILSFYLYLIRFIYFPRYIIVQSRKKVQLYQIHYIQMQQVYCNIKYCFYIRQC